MKLFVGFFLLHLAAANGERIIEVFHPDARKQTFTAPKTAVYTMTAVGAKGGDCYGCNKAT